MWLIYNNNYTVSFYHPLFTINVLHGTE